MATMAQEVPQVKLWDPTGELVGVVTIFNGFKRDSKAGHREEDFLNKVSKLYSHRNENIYEVEKDGRLKKPDPQGTRLRIRELLQPSIEAPYPNHPRTRYDTATANATPWGGKPKRSKSLPPRARDAQRLKDYEISTMSREGPSSGRGEHHQHSGSTYQLGNSMRVLSSPLLEEESSQDLHLHSYENEGKVISVERVKPNASQKIKRHSSESNAVTPTQEEQSRYTNGNADEENTFNYSKDASKEEDRSWGWQWRTGAAVVEPRFDPPDINRPPVHPPTPYAKAMKPPGGPKPRNTLTSSNAQPAYVPPSHKPFDLTGEYEHRTKRQRTDNGSMLGNGSVREVINLDSHTPSGPKRRESPTAISGQTATKNSTSTKNPKNPVPEFSNVEDMVNPRRHSSQSRNRPGISKRKSSNLDGYASQESMQSKPRASKPKLTVVRLDNEDPDDPIISENDIEFEMPSQRIMTSSTTRVVIGGKTGYKGTANHRPARHAQSGSRTYPTNSEATSRFFHSGQSGITVKGDPRSMKFSNDITSGKPQTTSWNSNVGSTKNHSSYHPDPQEASDDAEDHLSAPGYIIGDQPPREVARDLLSKLRKTQGSSTTGRNNALHSHTVIDDSEDELNGAQNDTDIKPTKFESSKSVKQKKGRRFEDQEYTVLQAFSLKQIWLQGERQTLWPLIYDSKDETLTLLDPEANSVMRLSTASIEKIEYNQENPRIVIHRSRTHDGIGHQVFFEFQNIDQCNSFRGHITEYDSTIQLLVKNEFQYLNRVFDRKLEEIANQKKRAPFMEEPEDIKFIKGMQALKTIPKLDQAQAGKKSQKLIHQLTDGDYESRPETRGSSRMRTMRSSSGPSEIAESTRRQTRQSRVSPSDFYGKSIDSRASDNYEPRSSSRVANRQPPRQRTRTPSPVRWTQLNPNWSETWKSSIVYPREGKNRATIDMQDIPRLDEGQYLNDSLINFYLRWLENRLLHDRPNLAKRIYFNNTFFYKTLTTVTRSHKGINYEAVERWTAKIDLLSYDYIIVPVNESTHWYVAIICNAPKLLPSDSATSDTSHSQTLRDGTSPKEEYKAAASSAPGGLPEQDMKSFESLSLQDEARGGDDDNPLPEADLDPVDLIGTTPPRTVAIDNTYDMGAKEEVETSTSRPVTANLELAGDQSKNPTPPKKGRRKSGAPSRKYNPSEPRIITLDSLGVKHSPTCTNLRDYIVAEIKARRGIEIPPPGPLGTTALNIPQQDNYCDCGLFLLSYVEKFLRGPDEFVRDILQQDPKILETPWSAASDMRVQIRDLLFELQKEQTGEAEKLKLLKAKAKKASSAERKIKPDTHSESREASKSARNSYTPEGSRREDQHPPKAPSPKSLGPDTQPVINRKRSASTDGNKSVGESKRRKQVEVENKHLYPESHSSKTVPNLEDEKYPASTPHLYGKGTSPTSEQAVKLGVNTFLRDNQDTLIDAPASRSADKSKFGQVLSSVARMFTGSERSTREPEHPQSGTSRKDAVEIDDSPVKGSTRSLLRRADHLSQQGNFKSPSPDEPDFPESESRGRDIKTHSFPKNYFPSKQAATNRPSQSREASAMATGEIPGTDDEMLFKSGFGAPPLSSPNISSPPRPQQPSHQSQVGIHPKQFENSGSSINHPFLDVSDKATVGRHQTSGKTSYGRGSDLKHASRHD